MIARGAFFGVSQPITTTFYNWASLGYREDLVMAHPPPRLTHGVSKRCPLSGHGQPARRTLRPRPTDRAAERPVSRGQAEHIAA